VPAVAPAAAYRRISPNAAAALTAHAAAGCAGLPAAAVANGGEEGAAMATQAAGQLEAE